MLQHTGKQRLVVALVAFVTSAVATVVAAASSPSSSASARPSTAAAPTAGAQTGGQDTSRGLRIGLSYGDTLTWKSDKDLATGLNDAVELGASWVRVDLSWNDIQPSSPNTYEWSRFDRVAKAARARNLDVLATISYTPSWARAFNCSSAADDQSCPPADPQTFASFAAKAAKRYAALGIHTWEIWNEPNIFWDPAPNATAYTQLLKATAKALRAADPKSYILLGGLAAVSTDKSAGYESQSDFLTEVAAQGGNKVVDAVSYHPYTYPYLPSAKTGFGTAYERISSYRDNLVGILARYGTPNLPIWITETGAPTDGPGRATDGTSIPPNTTHVTEGFQAKIASDTVNASAANPHVAAMFWFSDQDSGTAADKQHRSLFYGLRRYDGSRKPAFAALKAAIAAYEQKVRAQG